MHQSQVKCNTSLLLSVIALRKCIKEKHNQNYRLKLKVSDKNKMDFSKCRAFVFVCTGNKILCRLSCWSYCLCNMDGSFLRQNFSECCCHINVEKGTFWYSNKNCRVCNGLHFEIEHRTIIPTTVFFFLRQCNAHTHTSHTYN